MQSTQSEEAWTPLSLYCFLVLSTHNLKTRGAVDRMCNLGNEKWGVSVFPLSRLCVCASMCIFILVITFLCVSWAVICFFFFFAFPWLLPPAFNCFLLRAALTCVLFPSQCAVYVQSCLPVCPLRSLNLSSLLSFWFQFTLLVWIFVSSLKKKVYLLFLSLCGTKSAIVASHMLKYCRRNLWCLCFNFTFHNDNYFCFTDILFRMFYCVILDQTPVSTIAYW